MHCDLSSASGCCDKWGYRKNGLPLIEREEDIEMRKKLLKRMVATFGCKGIAIPVDVVVERGILQCFVFSVHAARSVKTEENFPTKGRFKVCNL